MPKYSTDNNSVQFFSRALEAQGFVPKQKRHRNDYIQECLAEYNLDGTSPERKCVLLREIVYNIWYLFPHILGGKKFPERLFDEALQNMVVEIMKAIERFDPDRKTKFSSYSAGWLRDAISSSVIADSVVKPPTTVDKSTLIKLASTSSKKKEEAEERLKENSKTQAPLQITNEDAIKELVAPQHTENFYCAKEIIDIVEEVISTENILSEREQMVIACRFGVFGAPKCTLEKVAEMFRARGWRASKEWIHQIEKRSLKKIRMYMEDCGIEAGDYAVFSIDYDYYSN